MRGLDFDFIQDGIHGRFVCDSNAYHQRFSGPIFWSESVDTTLPGYSLGASDSLNAAACQQLCLETPGCVAIDFVTFGTTNCFVKYKTRFEKPVIRFVGVIYYDFTRTTPGRCNSIQCGAVIARSIVSKLFTKDTHSSPVRARYGVYFVYPASDWCSGWVLPIIYVISYYIGPYYKATRL